MYGKLFAQMYDGTLSQHGWQALVTFQQFIILADQDGQVDMTLEAMSRRTTIPLEILEQGMGKLLAPDPHSRTPDEEGRRLLPLVQGRPWGWRIVNHEHYRKIRTAEERREYLRTYQADKRAGVPKGQRGKVSTVPSTKSTKSTDAVSSKQEADAITADADDAPAAVLFSLRKQLQDHAIAALLGFDAVTQGSNSTATELAARVVLDQIERSGIQVVTRALVDMAGKRVRFSMSAFQKFVRGVRPDVPVGVVPARPRDDRWCVECGDGELKILPTAKRGQRVHLEGCSRAPAGIS